MASSRVRRCRLLLFLSTGRAACEGRCWTRFSHFAEVAHACILGVCCVGGALVWVLSTCCGFCGVEFWVFGGPLGFGERVPRGAGLAKRNGARQCWVCILGWLGALSVTGWPGRLVPRLCWAAGCRGGDQFAGQEKPKESSAPRGEYAARWLDPFVFWYWPRILVVPCF